MHGSECSPSQRSPGFWGYFLRSNPCETKGICFCFWHNLMPSLRLFHEELSSIYISVLQQLIQAGISLFQTPFPLHCGLWPGFTTTCSFSLLFLFSHGKCLPAFLYEFIYALCHFLQEKKKEEKSQQHKHRQCKCKVCNAESPFAKCICAPLLTWNKEDGSHYPGQGLSHRWVTVVWLTCWICI